MPFDPNWPTFKAKNASAKWREQLTGLKGVIDAKGAGLMFLAGNADSPAVIAKLNEIVSALTGLPVPVAMAATGYGYPEANGILTQSGIHDGKPWYTIAGG